MFYSILSFQSSTNNNINIPEYCQRNILGFLKLLITLTGSILEGCFENVGKAG